MQSNSSFQYARCGSRENIVTMPWSSTGSPNASETGRRTRSLANGVPPRSGSRDPAKFGSYQRNLLLIKLAAQRACLRSPLQNPSTAATSQVLVCWAGHPSASSFRQIHAELEGTVVLHRYDSCDAGCCDVVVGHHDRHVRQENEARIGLLVLKGDIH